MSQDFEKNIFVRISIIIVKIHYFVKWHTRLCMELDVSDCGTFSNKINLFDLFKKDHWVNITWAKNVKILIFSQIIFFFRWKIIIS